MRAIERRSWLLPSLLFIFLSFVACIAYLYIKTRPPSDTYLIDSRFRFDLPGFSQLDIIDRTSTDKGSKRTINGSVIIDSFPTSLTCQFTMIYRSGDPYLLWVSWQDETCSSHYQMVIFAQNQLLADFATQSLPPQAEVVTLILKRWIEKGWLSSSDIKNEEMRRRITLLLQPGDD